MMTGNETWELLCQCGAANLSRAERDNFEHFAHANGIPLTAYYVISHANEWAKIALRRGIGKKGGKHVSHPMPKIVGVV